MSGINASDILGTSNHQNAFRVKPQTTLVDLLLDGAYDEIRRTYGWALHLRANARSMARFLKLDPWEVELAALLCRIGEVIVPKGAAHDTPDDPECAGNTGASRMRSAELTGQTFQHIPRLKPVARIIRYAEKNFDGPGFPADGIGEAEIPIGARILKVLLDLAELESQSVGPVARFSPRAPQRRPLFRADSLPFEVGVVCKSPAKMLGLRR